MRKITGWLCLAAAGILFLTAGVFSWEESKNAGNCQEVSTVTEEDENYIKWVEFHVTDAVLDKALSCDIDTYGGSTHLNWVELLAYLGAKYGGDFSKYKETDLDVITEKLLSGETTVEQLSAEMKYFDYYREAYGAVLDGLTGVYEIKTENGWEKKYGLKGFSPIAKGFPYSHYDDFGASRSYGYRRKHLGHDLLGQIGTPIVAVESGYVSAMGWNQYGGWRIGINSFDGKRYYYYAHLRQNFPYNKDLKEGSIVQAGDVIGYMGHTGYSTKENTNNIDTVHLHFGIQLIFHESQREGNYEIWIDCYELVKFLARNQSEVKREDSTKEWYRIHEFMDPAVKEYEKECKDSIKKDPV